MTDSWVTVNFLKHYHLEIKSNDENEEHGCMCFLRGDDKYSCLKYNMLEESQKRPLHCAIS